MQIHLLPLTNTIVCELVVLELRTHGKPYHQKCKQFSALIGFVEANAFLAYNYLKKENMNHATFREDLTSQLINISLFPTSIERRVTPILQDEINNIQHELLMFESVQKLLLL